MSQLSKIIKEEIALQGVIPFARFMELALYCPDYGFYEKESDTVGRAGDFYTSVSVGSLFGELLAFQFADWLAAMPREKFQIVEAGAHDGKLAADILNWLREHRADLFERLEYVILEPSVKRRAWQEERLKDFAGRVQWQTGFSSAEAEFSGVIFANELLDAMPVRRLGWDLAQREWFEWGVTWSDGNFKWTKIAAGTVAELADLPVELLEVLPDNFTTEISPAAEAWWRRAAWSLRAGYLITADYGLRAEEFFLPARAQGTLRAYRRHRVTTDLLDDPGTQDLTAHVNFSHLRRVGEAAGLKTIQLVDQGSFIARAAANFWTEAQKVGRWSAKQNRELQTLMHPEHLGRAFKVLVQSRGVRAELTDERSGNL